MSMMRLPTNDALMLRRLAKAAELSGTHHMADVAATIKAGHAQWWCNGDGGAVTEILDYPRGRVLNYWLVCGELRACLRMQPEIEAWAMDLGCTTATASGRPQWARVVEPYGWIFHSCLWRKPLEKAGSA